VKVDVGTAPKLQTFDVHIDLVTARSDFFKKALSREWKEAAEKVVKLPDDDPEVLQSMYIICTLESWLSSLKSNITQPTTMLRRIKTLPTYMSLQRKSKISEPRTPSSAPCSTLAVSCSPTGPTSAQAPTSSGLYIKEPLQDAQLAVSWSTFGRTERRVSGSRVVIFTWNSCKIC
jgi:hypothetical protein